MTSLEDLWYGNVNPHEAMNEMHSLAEVEAFSCGFRLGVKLMIEAGVP